MQDEDKTKEQLIAELRELRQQVAEAEKNITERKETQKAPWDSEAKYRRIVETANAGIWSLDENFVTTFVNARMVEMIGYDESEMIGRPVHWFMFEEDLADLREKMRDRRAGISDCYERRYRHKDGRTVWMMLSVTPLVDDEDGSFKGSFSMVTDITERKLMEEKLRLSEEKYRSMVETTSDCIWEMDSQGHYTYLSPGFQDQTGYPPEEFIGRTPLDLLPEDNRPHDREQFLSIVAAREPFTSIEHHFRHRDGRLAVVEVSGVPLFGVEGEYLGMRGIGRDITERKRAEEELQVSHERLALAQRAAKTGFWDWEIPTGRLTWSREFHELFGLNRSAPESFDTWLKLLHPDDRDPAMKRITRSIDKRTPLENEYRITGPNGEERWISALGDTFYDEAGRPQRMCGICIDVTQRKRSEEALRGSEERFRTFMDNSPTIAWIKDEKGRYAYISKTSEKRFGIRLEDWLGKTDFEIWPLEIAEEFRKNDLEALRGGEPIQVVEETTNSGTGRCIWWNSKFPFWDASGERYVGGIGLDITRIKRMEEELRKSRDELDIRVRERTAALERANRQLRLFPSKLIAAQEEERRRIAGELHDSIGQTLAALKYGVEMILVKKGTGDLTGAFKLLERFVPTLQQSIEETRSIYMGLRPPMLDSLGLLATLEWFCREFQSVHSRLHLDLKTGIEEEEIPDHLRITIFRMVQEALNNVAKHSGARGVELSVVKNQDSIELLIRDDGAGFDLESTMRDDPKTLGLAGMRERVESTAGTFSVESAPDEGTTLRAVWSD